VPLLSDCARSILARMEPDRRYAPEDLREFLPDTSVEGLREVMHELWVNREVERAGHGTWRRHRSIPPHACLEAARETETVRPEDLFDHAGFADFFK
jgi:hypothetical protein